MEATLEIFYRPVEALNTGFNIPGVYHAFIVYTNEDGERFIFSGFPETDDETIATEVEGFGRLRVDWEKLDENSYDYKFYSEQKATNTASHTLLSGSELDGFDVVAIGKRVEASIESRDIGYNVMFTNSNSAVAAFAKAFGIDDLPAPPTVPVPLNGHIVQVGFAPGLSNSELFDFNAAGTSALEQLGQGYMNRVETEMALANRILDLLNLGTPDYQIGSIKLNTEASINGGWPDDNNIVNDDENRFEYLRAA